MEKTKKILRSLIIFLLLIWITFYIVLKDQDITQIFDILKNTNKVYIIIAIFSMCMYLILEAVNLGRTLKVLNEKSSFIKNVKYALIGFFFSAITPAASGGQPMQIYYMYKDKISVANSTLALMINLCSIQIITISFALISIFFNYKYLSSGLIIFFIVGVSLNASALILLLIGIFSKKLAAALINFSVKVLKFFKIKNVEQKKEKLEKELELYQVSSEYIKKNKLVIFKTLITTFIQFLLFYSISYWVYCSFGFNEFNIVQIITLQAVLYATVSGIPSPGAVGVTEGGFMSIFKSVYPSTMISSAMLLNRGISFYLFVIITAIVVVISLFKSKKIEKS